MVFTHARGISGSGKRELVSVGVTNPARPLRAAVRRSWSSSQVNPNQETRTKCVIIFPK